MSTLEDRSYERLSALWAEARDEIKRRIEQRDRYSIQLTIGLGVLVGISFSERGFREALIAAPIVALYFTVLILYSYRVHHELARYLRSTIEPALAALAKTPVSSEIETYYAGHHVPGIRRQFFLATLWITTIGAPLFVLSTGNPEFRAPVASVAVLCLIGVAIVTKVFWRD